MAPTRDTPAPDARDTHPQEDRMSQPQDRPRGTRKQSTGKPPLGTRDSHKAAHEGSANGQGLRRRGTRRRSPERNGRHQGLVPAREGQLLYAKTARECTRQGLSTQRWTRDKSMLHEWGCSQGQADVRIQVRPAEEQGQVHALRGATEDWLAKNDQGQVIACIDVQNVK